MPENQETDIKLIELLSNKPSDPIEIEGSKARVIFKAPAFADKYKSRAWSSRKLKEIGITEEEDPDLAYYFRYWGTLNSYVKTIYVEDSGGNVKLDGKKYSEYHFDPNTDLDYKFLFEKYVIEEMYPRGYDEQFVTNTVMKHLEWVQSRTMEEDDIKNS